MWGADLPPPLIKDSETPAWWGLRVYPGQEQEDSTEDEIIEKYIDLKIKGKMKQINCWSQKLESKQNIQLLSK